MVGIVEAGAGSVSGEVSRAVNAANVARYEQFYAGTRSTSGGEPTSVAVSAGGAISSGQGVPLSGIAYMTPDGEFRALPTTPAPSGTQVSGTSEPRIAPATGALPSTPAPSGTQVSGTSEPRIAPATGASLESQITAGAIPSPGTAPRFGGGSTMGSGASGSWTGGGPSSVSSSPDVAAMGYAGIAGSTVFGRSTLPMGPGEIHAGGGTETVVTTPTQQVYTYSDSPGISLIRNVKPPEKVGDVSFTFSGDKSADVSGRYGSMTVSTDLPKDLINQDILSKLGTTYAGEGYAYTREDILANLPKGAVVSTSGSELTLNIPVMQEYKFDTGGAPSRTVNMQGIYTTPGMFDIADFKRHSIVTGEGGRKHDVDITPLTGLTPGEFARIGEVQTKEQARIFGGNLTEIKPTLEGLSTLGARVVFAQDLGTLSGFGSKYAAQLQGNIEAGRFSLPDTNEILRQQQIESITEYRQKGWLPIVSRAALVYGPMALTGMGIWGPIENILMARGFGIVGAAQGGYNLATAKTAGERGSALFEIGVSSLLFGSSYAAENALKSGSAVKIIKEYPQESGTIKDWQPGGGAVTGTVNTIRGVSSGSSSLDRANFRSVMGEAGIDTAKINVVAETPISGVYKKYDVELNVGGKPAQYQVIKVGQGDIITNTVIRGTPTQEPFTIGGVKGTLTTTRASSSGTAVLNEGLFVTPIGNAPVVTPAIYRTLGEAFNIDMPSAKSTMISKLGSKPAPDFTSADLYKSTGSAHTYEIKTPFDVKRYFTVKDTGVTIGLDESQLSGSLQTGKGVGGSISLIRKDLGGGKYGPLMTTEQVIKFQGASGTNIEPGKVVVGATEYPVKGPFQLVAGKSTSLTYPSGTRGTGVPFEAKSDFVGSIFELDKTVASAGVGSRGAGYSTMMRDLGIDIKYPSGAYATPSYNAPTNMYSTSAGGTAGVLVHAPEVSPAVPPRMSTIFDVAAQSSVSNVVSGGSAAMGVSLASKGVPVYNQVLGIPAGISVGYGRPVLDVASSKESERVSPPGPIVSERSSQLFAPEIQKFQLKDIEVSVGVSDTSNVLIQKTEIPVSQKFSATGMPFDSGMAQKFSTTQKFDVSSLQIQKFPTQKFQTPTTPGIVTGIATGVGMNVPPFVPALSLPKGGGGGGGGSGSGGVGRIRPGPAGRTPRKSLYPDLASVIVSQARYGKATYPRFTTGQIEAQGKTFYSNVPTKELMGRKGGRRMF